MQNLRKFDKPPMEQQKICFFISTSTAQIQGLNYWLATLRKQKVCKKPEIKASTSYKKIWFGYIVKLWVLRALIIMFKCSHFIRTRKYLKKFEFGLTKNENLPERPLKYTAVNLKSFVWKYLFQCLSFQSIEKQDK